MANRKTSSLLQLGTLVLLGLAYIVGRRKKKACDSIYCVRPGPLALISTALLAADVVAIPKILRAKPVISADELAALASVRTPRYDRLALRYQAQYAEGFRTLSDKVLMTTIAVPLLIMLAQPAMRRDWKTLFALYAWVQSLCYSLYSFSPLGPAFVDKYRPAVYYATLSEKLRNLGNNRNARFSGHTAAAASASFFTAAVFRAYAKHSAFEAHVNTRGAYALALVPSMLVGALRTLALKHFPSDVAVAIAIGACFGIGVPKMYEGGTLSQK